MSEELFKSQLRRIAIMKAEPVLERLGSDYDENGVPYWEKRCYYCNGSGLLQTVEECFCVSGVCDCKNCAK